MPAAWMQGTWFGSVWDAGMVGRLAGEPPRRRKPHPKEGDVRAFARRRVPRGSAGPPRVHQATGRRRSVGRLRGEPDRGAARTGGRRPRPQSPASRRLGRVERPEPDGHGPDPGNRRAGRPGARLPLLRHPVRPGAARLRGGGVLPRGHGQHVHGGQRAADDGPGRRRRAPVPDAHGRAPPGRPPSLQRHRGGRVVQRHGRLRRRGELVPLPRGDRAGGLRLGRRLGPARRRQLPQDVEPHPLRDAGRERGRHDRQRRARLGRLLAGAAGDPEPAGRRAARPPQGEAGHRRRRVVVGRQADAVLQRDPPAGRALPTRSSSTARRSRTCWYARIWTRRCSSC